MLTEKQLRDRSIKLDCRIEDILIYYKSLMTMSGLPHSENCQAYAMWVDAPDNSNYKVLGTGPCNCGRDSLISTYKEILGIDPDQDPYVESKLEFTVDIVKDIFRKSMSNGSGPTKIWGGMGWVVNLTESQAQEITLLLNDFISNKDSE